MLFKRKNPGTMTPAQIQKLDRLPLKYVTERDSETARELRLGENGAVNIMDGDFVLVCGGKDVFRAPVGEVKVGELMNLSGLVASYTDKNGLRRSVIAYYSDGAIGLRR